MRTVRRNQSRSFMKPVTFWRWQVCSIFVSCLMLSSHCIAQQVKLNDDEAPSDGTVAVYTSFTVYASSANPGSVELADFRLHLDPTRDRTYHEGMITVGLAKHENLYAAMDAKQFCCREDQDHAANACTSIPGLHRFPSSHQAVLVLPLKATTPDSAASQTAEADLKEDGLYLLFVANCGAPKEAGGVIKMSGTIRVKNSHGWLPGIEFPKLGFYAGLTIAYACLGAIWVAALIIWRRLVVTFQKFIGSVLAASFVESALWTLLFGLWNRSPSSPSTIVTLLAVVASVFKAGMAYSLILVCSLGWGSIRPRLERSTKKKIWLLAGLYVVFDTSRAIATVFFTEAFLDNVYLSLLILLPVSLLHSVLFFWTLSALSETMTVLKRDGQSEKLALFQRIAAILIVAMSVATISFLFEVVFLARDLSSRWQTQWWLTDGVSQLIYFGVLLYLMYLFSPQRDARRYMYSDQLPSGDGEVFGAETIGKGASDGGDGNNLHRTETRMTQAAVWNEKFDEFSDGSDLDDSDVDDDPSSATRVTANGNPAPAKSPFGQPIRDGAANTRIPKLPAAPTTGTSRPAPVIGRQNSSSDDSIDI